MKRMQWLSALGIVLLVATSMVAQEKPGTIAALEFQKPKNGMVPQYETGRKQKAAWHKQQNDPLPLFVWETLSGENTGTYIVGRLGQHWADFDKLSHPDVHDAKRWTAVAGARGQVRDKYLLGGGVSLYERVHFLRGLENTWLDIHDAPQELGRLLDLLVEMNLAAISYYAAADYDGFIFCDDWGLQNRLMIAPAIWRCVVGVD